jgi:plasmid stability protein
MARIVLEDVDLKLLSKLSELAARNNRSVEDQAKDMLNDAVQALSRTINADRVMDRVAMAKAIAAMTPRGVVQSDSTLLIREDRDR